METGYKMSLNERLTAR